MRCGWEKRIPTDLPEEVGDHGRAQPSAVNSPVLTERLAQPAAQKSVALVRQHRPYEGEPRADGVGISQRRARDRVRMGAPVHERDGLVDVLCVKLAEVSIASKRSHL